MEKTCTTLTPPTLASLWTCGKTLNITFIGSCRRVGPMALHWAICPHIPMPEGVEQSNNFCVHKSIKVGWPCGEISQCLYFTFYFNREMSR